MKVLGLMKKSLLTPAEVGKGFTNGPAYSAASTSTPPCGGKSVVSLYPNALRSGIFIVSGETVQFEESLSLFVDTETAQKAFAAQIAGVTCSKPKVNGTAVTISAGQDVTAQVGGEKAIAYEVTIGADSGVLVAVGSGSLTIGFTFVAAGGTDTSKLPNPLDLAKKATAKVIAAGLG